MSNSIEITGIKYDIDSKVSDYARKKLTKLERFISRHARKSARFELKLTQHTSSSNTTYEADILLHIPEKILSAKAPDASNIYAAIDLAADRLRGQLRRHKTATVSHIGKGRILDRFKRSYAREQQES
jgi:putative sigma-54 modulation protein